MILLRFINVLRVFLGFFFFSVSLCYGQFAGSSKRSVNLIPKNLNASISNTTISNLKNSDFYDRSIQNNFSLGLSYKYKNLNAFFSTAFNKKLTADRSESFSNGNVGFSHPIYKFNEYVKSTGKVSFALPYSKDSREKKFRTSIYIAPTFSFNISKFIKGLSVSYTPSYKYNFYKYTIDESGNSNIEYILSNIASTNYSYKKFNLSLSFSYSRAFTHFKNTSDVYAFDQSISYMLKNNLSITLGHNIDGDVLASNQSDTDIKFFDQDRSSIYFNVGMSLR